MKYVFDAERISNWVCEKAGGAYQPNYTAIGIEKNGVLQAAFIYHTFTGENGSIVMGGRCDNKFSTTRLFYAMAFNYPFEQLGVKRINSLIKKSNKDAFAINKNLRFIQEIGRAHV